MANPLTGDFEAVLQVSGATVNRLLASMHQNAGSNSETPSFPHSVAMRVGDPDPVDGMRGWIAGQVSVPKIDLIHGVSDRFWIEVSVRARYSPDAGTVPIPEFIHGTIRAQYKIDSIDPNCWGWEKIAGDFLWVHVLADTVSFTGTAVDDIALFASVQNPIDPSTADARITTLARHLLVTRFRATPHKVSKRFRRGTMRSLNPGTSGSLVAVPIGLSSDPSAGKIDSINQDILAGRDVGIAINSDYIIRRIQEVLDSVKESFKVTYGIVNKTHADLGFAGGIDVLTANITYTITLKSATAQWIGGVPAVSGVSMPGGLFAINLFGHARTEKPIFNFDFGVTQPMIITFDASEEKFVAAPFGAATVALIGLLASIAESKVKPRIQQLVADAMTSAGGDMTDQLTLEHRKSELEKQLQTMDKNAHVWFTDLVGTADGIIVRGDITLSSRKAPVQSFTVTPAKDGFSAFHSWIPGGRIDSFNWSWKWRNTTDKPGFQSEKDRYLLRRPPGKTTGKYGLTMGVNTPLPGLDGMGQLCLVLSGEHIDPVTGKFVTVFVKRRCARFGVDLGFSTPDRLFLREWKPGPRDPIGPVAEVAVHEVNTRRGPGSGNTLVVRAGNGWNREAAMALRDGLADSHRRDAGLVVLLLLNDGELAQADSGMLEEFRALAAELEAPLVINEDVEGSWSRAFRMRDSDSIEWRLIAPTGGVTWARSGNLAPRDLATALDDYLMRSPVADFVHIHEGLPLGSQISELAFESDVIGRLARMDEACPPPPFERLGLESAVKFVKKNSTSSDSAMHAAQEDDGSFRIVVVDGADDEDVERMRDALGGGAIVIADPDGTISRKFGIRSWPASAKLSRSGTVMEFEVTEHE